MKKLTAFRLDPELLARVDAVAGPRGRTRFVEEALEAALAGERLSPELARDIWESKALERQMYAPGALEAALAGSSTEELHRTREGNSAVGGSTPPRPASPRAPETSDTELRSVRNVAAATGTQKPLVSKREYRSFQRGER